MTFIMILTQMRHGARSLVGIAIAIVLGVGFVTSTLLLGALLQQAAWNSVAAQYDGADIVISTDFGEIPAQTVDMVRTTDGVATAEGRQFVSGVLTSGSRSTYPVTANLPETASIRDAIELDAGRLPTGPGEIALLRNVADQVKVSVGDQVSLSTFDASNPTTPLESPFTVVGIIPGNGSVGITLAPDAYGWPADVASLAQESGLGSILITVAPGTNATALADELSLQLADDPTPNEVTARTRDDQARYLVSEVSDGTDILTVGLLAFAAVALFVAGIVISNTFTILVAHRTRTLALLRCVGATRAQVRRSVLTEALIVGLLASAAGVLVGIGVVRFGMWLIGSISSQSFLPDELTVPLRAVLVPVGLGLIVTLTAAWGPARGATRVSPLAALRPAALETVRSRVSRPRIALSIMLIGAGILELAAGVGLSLSDPSTLTVLVSVAGGMLSFLGILVGSVLIVPGVVRMLGSASARFGGAPAAIAASNSARNPRRTTATTTALLVAVTLITTMSVGAASTRSTLSQEIDARSPVDLIVQSVPEYVGGNVDRLVVAPLPGALGSAVAANPDVGSTTPVWRIEAQVNGELTTVLAVNPDAAGRISREPDQLAGLAPGTMIVPAAYADQNGIADGNPLTVSADGDARTFLARVTDLAGPELLAVPEDVLAVDPDATQSQLWVRFEDGTDANEAVGTIQDALAGYAGISYWGGAQERQDNERILDAILLVVVALLGVAVVIALVGIGNTLSLSVIERTRESAILRAMGLTRQQMRRMLAIEGVLIALVGAALGILLGTVYGLLGALTLLGNTWGVAFSVPLGQLAMIVVIAVVAGVLASVLPARTAARTSPVAALAE